jgi:hypothetical protein
MRIGLRSLTLHPHAGLSTAKNRTMTTQKILLLATFSLLSGAGKSWATPPTANILTSGLGSGWNVRINNSQNVWSGQIKLTASNSGDGQKLANGVHNGYCVEILEHTWIGANRLYNIVGADTIPNQPGPMGVAKANAIRDMYAFANGAQFGSNNDFASAFQIAIWEVVNDGPGNLNVSSGNFTASNFGSAGVSTYLTSLFAAVGSGSGSTIGLTGLSNGSAGSPGYQDFIVPGPPPAPTTPNLTPEAPGYTLFLALLLPFSLALYKKRFGRSVSTLR